ncbi:MAG: YjjG family noncanonical pyrimidine nucleotidase [Candidatus Promineifilaceae bacterium]
MKYKWILFDADNTLFDYDAAERGALSSTFEELGRPLLPEHVATYRQINHRNWLAFEQGEITQAVLRVRRFEQFITALEMKEEPLPVSQRYLFHLGNRTDLIEGALELMETLHGRIGLMMITNGLKDVQRSRLKQSEIGRFFSDVVISEEVGFAKPDGRIFDIAFERMGNPQKSEVLVVGDSLTSDIQGGLDYGVDTCWFNPGKRPNTLDKEVSFEIGQLAELTQIL